MDFFGNSGEKDKDKKSSPSVRGIININKDLSGNKENINANETNTNIHTRPLPKFRPLFESPVTKPGNKSKLPRNPGYDGANKDQAEDKVDINSASLSSSFGSSLLRSQSDFVGSSSFGLRSAFDDDEDDCI